MRAYEPIDRWICREGSGNHERRLPSLPTLSRGLFFYSVSWGASRLAHAQAAQDKEGTVPKVARYQLISSKIKQIRGDPLVPRS